MEEKLDSEQASKFIAVKQLVFESSSVGVNITEDYNEEEFISSLGEGVQVLETHYRTHPDPAAKVDIIYVCQRQSKELTPKEKAHKSIPLWDANKGALIIP